MYSVSLKWSFRQLSLFYGAFMVPFSGDVKSWQECHMPSFISSDKNQAASPFTCHGKCVLCSLVGYSKSWEVCSQLGQSEGFQDLGMRRELMAFALIHCPPSAIQALLAVSRSLQIQVPLSGPSFMKVQCLPK